MLAEGWLALARGDLARASKAAQRAVADWPRSVSAVSLGVEVDIARAGPVTALDTYERWLAGRKVDAAHVLRRIASAFLQGAVRDRKSGAARFDALTALVVDGDAEASASVATAAAGGGVFETRLMARAGNERAVQTLISQLGSLPDTVGTVNALVESRSALAVGPLVQLLRDVRDENRAAAADGLGRLGAHEAIDQIKPLLKDVSFPVRLAAAAALYRLGDDLGAPLLDQLLVSEHSAIRLGAAEALSVRPGGAWLSVARTLTTDSDQMVQLGAARLLAPYDRELAQGVLERLSGSDNLAIREEASRIVANRIAADFGVLRRLLRSPDRGTVVRGAARILELTR